MTKHGTKDQLWQQKYQDIWIASFHVRHIEC